MTFRNDINFLRFVAVMSVVLFHFFPEYFPGGFIGVDIFFVISGFLMTGIIVSKLESASFSILDFYIARVNRICPPLIIVIIILLVFSVLYLPAFDIKQLVKHSSSSLVFLSNYIYFSESGYFDSSSLSKYMLHTWSLSVEWQFYILFPLYILLVYKKWSTNGVLISVVSLLVFSLIISIYYTYYHTSAAYFFLESRAWQLLSGSLVYLISKRKSIIIGNKAVIICFFILFSIVFIFDKEMKWPGFLGIIPVFLCCFILISKSKLTIFSNKLSSFIGKSSYSIYLWHWPVVVIINKIYPKGLILGFFVSLFLGSLSYIIIERKVKVNIYIILSSSLLISMLCVFIFLSGGKVYWLNDKFRTFDSSVSSSPFRDKCHSNPSKEITPEESCILSKGISTWAVIGDSHGVELAYSLSKELDDQSVQQFTFSSCPPSYGQTKEFSLCSSWYNKAATYILNDSKIKNVVIIHRYSAHLIEGSNTLNRRNEILKSLELFVHDLESQGKNVFIVNPVPEIDKPVSDFALQASFNGKKIHHSDVLSISYSDYLERNNIILSFISNLRKKYYINIVNTQNIYCNLNDCFAIKNGNSLYFDSNHPSVFGAELIAKKIVKADKDAIR